MILKLLKAHDWFAKTLLCLGIMGRVSGLFCGEQSEILRRICQKKKTEQSVGYVSSNVSFNRMNMT